MCLSLMSQILVVWMDVLMWKTLRGSKQGFMGPQGYPHINIVHRIGDSDVLYSVAGLGFVRGGGGA